MKQGLFCIIIVIVFTSFCEYRRGRSKLSVNASVYNLSDSNLSIKVVLSNNTADTIKYIGWTCSWEKLYSIDNDRWKIRESICFKNGLIEYKIPPFQKETKILELEKVNAISKSKSSKFKIGFQFISPPPPNSYKNAIIKLEDIKSENVTIWSNTLPTNLSLK